MGDITKNFSKIEYTCKCGCGTYIDSQHIADEDQIIRDYISKKEGKNIPIIIHCGCRCPEHNAKIGGVLNSRHLPIWYNKKQGASDKHARGISNWKFRKYIKQMYKLGMLQGGVGMYRWGCHTDTSQKRIWGGWWKK